MGPHRKLLKESRLKKTIVNTTVLAVETREGIRLRDKTEIANTCALRILLYVLEGHEERKRTSIQLLRDFLPTVEWVVIYRVETTRKKSLGKL